MAYRLENWKILVRDDGFTPPEGQARYLQGVVYGHPTFENGDRVSTSAIVHVDGRVCRTLAGSEYRLGEISPEYRKWIEENFPGQFDPENPVDTRLL